MVLDKEIKEELNTIIKKYGLFNSSHEFYAVISEELDEMYEEIQEINDCQLIIWNNIKRNESFQETAKKLDVAIDDLIHEVIQVKAIIQKLDKSAI